MALQLLNDGWDYHATESERLAGELEAAAGSIGDEDLDPLLHLGVHTIGEHLGDWPRALRLAEDVLAARTPRAETARAWSRLGVARTMAGDATGALAAELAAQGAATDALAAMIEARFLLVAALVGSKRSAEAAALFDAALTLAGAVGEAAPARAIAVASNNLAAELLEADARTPGDDALMDRAADAAYVYWLRAGDWVNEALALGLKTAVALALGRPHAALELSADALRVIAANGKRPIDTALLHLARSRANAAVGDAARRDHELALADAAAEDAPNEGLKAWYAEERAKALA
ncbi:MAG TPA: hypothetical protein VGF50_07265 [Caulobacteraceae bacterium]|jgi:hypothetical protein